MMRPRRRRLPQAIARIGLIQPSAIGDMFLISGLVAHLHRLYPASEIHVFHSAFNGSAVQFLLPEVIGHRCDFTNPRSALRELRDSRLDVLINCAPWTRLTALLTSLSGAKATYGFRSKGQGIHPAFDVTVPYRSDRHEIANHHAMAELFGPLDTYRLTIRPLERSPSKALPYDRLVLMHATPGGSAATPKSWPQACWAELVRRLTGKGFVVGFTGTQADEAAVGAILDAAKASSESAFSLAGALSLPELAYALNRARLLVTVDTGVAHLAAALDAPVVCLHGPTRFARWGACNSGATGVDSSHPAAGYIHFGFESHPQQNAVMETISVDAVEAAVIARLSATKDSDSESAEDVAAPRDDSAPEQRARRSATP
ncbi:glycosyltransferase family 9 protein [Bradyrhizobium sp. 1]|uniref:glycosyltransferase family 9 protein n=1 Tax=Bradyrhizobium sp. 1 TaxID=241591 RepID=UPI001FF951D0|nr:glycosyltransferase family 9 protein [Bradyrhizobium sp. 1]MCK1396158.1 glycosyltransferase family 9 protein [Bradyrhizobium sp. 1]